jgi:hypothetical protein
LEDLGVDGGIYIVMDLKEIICEGVDWIHVAQDGDQRWTVANTGIKFFSIKDGEFLTS